MPSSKLPVQVLLRHNHHYIAPSFWKESHSYDCVCARASECNVLWYWPGCMKFAGGILELDIIPSCNQYLQWLSE